MSESKCEAQLHSSRDNVRRGLGAITFISALLALLVLITVPFTHRHQGSESNAQCASCVAQLHKANVVGAAAAVTLTLQIELPQFQFTEFRAAPSRELWIDTLSRGPPAA